jgi:DNA-binding transcriptional MocR family regulator
VQQVLGTLGDWGSREGPLYHRLAAALSDAIETGQIGRGTVLPPERALAQRLAIGRSTVVAAYELLREEGHIQSRRGSGSWVSGAAPHRDPAAALEGLPAAALRASGGLIDLATAARPAPPEVRAALVGLAEDSAALFDSYGYSPAGLPDMHQAVARYLTAAGLPTDADQILITTGDQQAIWLLCQHLLADGGEAIVEDPTSPGILDVLRALPAPIRSAGPLAQPSGAAELVAAVARADAQLLYLLPTPNPRGEVASAQSRRELLQALRGRDVHVIEDLSAMDLVFEPAPPPLAALPGGERVICVGSMSKLLWGGLRIGFVRAAPTLIGRLTRLKIRVDLGTPLLSQLLAARLLDQVMDVRRDGLTQLRRQLDHSLVTVRRQLPDLELHEPAGGLNLWLKLPRGTSTAFVEVAARHGVAVVPGAALSHRGDSDNCLRVVYARAEVVFDEGILRLAAAWHSYSELSTTRPVAASEVPIVV